MTPDPPGARLVYLDDSGQERIIEIPPEGGFLGRAATCEIRLDDRILSRRQCRLFRDQEAWWIEDTTSTGGTYVNHQRILRQPLRDGDEIRCGSLRLRFTAPVPRG